MIKYFIATVSNPQNNYNPIQKLILNLFNEFPRMSYHQSSTFSFRNNRTTVLKSCHLFLVNVT
ncbi:hypothetical protein, partial [Aquimarina megaterium]|uniref:hypothetical protein n=1 Tax=Aquimarina megaterium TaxID=1443666 RepID=UPI0019D40C61